MGVKLVSLALAGLVLVGPAAAALAPPPVVSAWDPLIAKGREEGTRYQTTKDDKAKSAAKKALKEAEKLTRDAVDDDPNCERCHEGLVTAAFQQAYFGISKDYDDFFEVAGAAQARFPGNGRIALFKGTAHYNTGQAGDALRSLKRYLGSAARDADTDATVTAMMQASQQAFVANWNPHARFYESNESKIIRMNPQTFKNEVIFQVSPDWELGSANQAAPGLLQMGAVRQDPELQAYLEALVGKLTDRSPTSPFAYKITVLDTPAINAVTVPGQIFVCTGLLGFVENEGELAGVLAHELAHNYGHHSARAVIKQWHAQNVANLFVNAANPKGQTEQAIGALVTNLGVNLFVRAYSRVEEREADLYGTHIMYNAGYNPTAMARFQLRMYEKNPKQPIGFLSTHPPSPDRAAYLTDYLEAFDLQQPLAVDSEKFQKMRGRFAPAEPGLPKAPGLPGGPVNPGIR